MRKGASIFVIVVGIAMIIVGLFVVSVPGDSLTTYSFSDKEYSEISEYVGGDAYNYMIGANLVGAKITGAIIAKAISICVGIALACIGILSINRISCQETIANKLDSLINETRNKAN